MALGRHQHFERHNRKAADSGLFSALAPAPIFSFLCAHLQYNSQLSISRWWAVMAVTWITLLKTVPWADVIAHAPKVAEGASKLWGAVGRKGGTEEAALDFPHQNPQEAISERLARTEEKVRELTLQMAQCSELLTQVAEQNSFLIARVEVERRRTRWIALGAGGSLIVALGNALVGMTR